MKSFELGLPLAILVLSFLMKLFVDRAPNLPVAVQTLYELPIDMVFLALTFAAAFVISKPNEAGRGMMHFVGYSVAAVCAIVLTRRSISFLDRNRWTVSVLLFMANLAVAAYVLSSSMNMVAPK